MVVQGEYRYPDGSVYNGQWDDQGQRHGQGLLTLADGGNFRGNFDQGFYSGLGVINFADGSRYCGEFLQGKFNGYGVFVRPDGMKYEGEFKDGKIKGQGRGSTETKPGNALRVHRWRSPWEHYECGSKESECTFV
ncbi:MORN repeat-containing protein 4 isoform X2 [Aplysia californica]|uniref:MORN repeat-containing protein 4 isoform X2 n=1 Tax=Aplysia californica TaxID=6500 RepID=A0ABM0JFT2_APLCA|nr:MORN repeat-containing protein 4 isoform X2 [Aplysia californica]